MTVLNVQFINVNTGHESKPKNNSLCFVIQTQLLQELASFALWAGVRYPNSRYRIRLKMESISVLSSSFSDIESLREGLDIQTSADIETLV